MDMDFLTLRTGGRAMQPLEAVVVRELTEADLPLLEGEKGMKPSLLKRLSDRHHSLARNLASGIPPGEAGLLCGYVASTVSILQNDPAFQELVEFYRRDVTAQYRDLHERLGGIAMDAAEELAVRLEEKPEEIGLGALMDLVKMGADRTGHGPSSTSNINVNDGLADKLKLARQRVAARQIEGTAKRIEK